MARITQTRQTGILNDYTKRFGDRAYDTQSGLTDKGLMARIMEVDAINAKRQVEYETENGTFVHEDAIDAVVGEMGDKKHLQGMGTQDLMTYAPDPILSSGVKNIDVRTKNGTVKMSEAELYKELDKVTQFDTTETRQQSVMAQVAQWKKEQAAEDKARDEANNLAQEYGNAIAIAESRMAV